MPGLVPGIHVLAAIKYERTWMAGTSPAMTKEHSISDSNILTASPTLRAHRLLRIFARFREVVIDQMIDEIVHRQTYAGVSR
jgi:hypothetical protein